MDLARALRHPLTPLVLVLVVLPLAAMAAPAPMRGGLCVLLLLFGAPLAAFASVRALPRALAKLAVPADAEPSPREESLLRAMRWFLALVPVLGAAAVATAALGVRGWRAPPAPGAQAEEWGLTSFQSLLLASVPVLFVSLGVRLWRDLADARRRRAAGLAPAAPPRPSATGDDGLDRRLRPSARAAQGFGFFTILVTAIANVIPPVPRDLDALPWAVRKLAALPDAIRQGEPYRFLTATFVHGDFSGLAVGLLSFAAVAPLVQAYAGGFWFGVAFVGGGFVAAVASWASDAPFMGMTGGAAALAGMLLFLGLFLRSRLPPAAFRRIAVRVGAVAVVLAFASALLPFASAAAHLGGFTFGAVLAVFARPSADTRAAMAEARAEALGRTTSPAARGA